MWQLKNMQIWQLWQLVNESPAWNVIAVDAQWLGIVNIQKFKILQIDSLQMYEFDSCDSLKQHRFDSYDSFKQDRLWQLINELAWEFVRIPVLQQYFPLPTANLLLEGQFNGAGKGNCR